MTSLPEIPQLPEGKVVAGRYRIGRLMGAGGMGAVYEAEHVELERMVAIKVLLPKWAEDKEVLERFLREARAAAKIGHPGIVDVFDLGTDEEGLAFLAMERLEGEELFDRIQRDYPLSPRFVARVGAEIADAIAAAHEHGIIHRDLKPQNVFLARQGRRVDVVKVLDFGIAKLAQGDAALGTITKTGQVYGTPLYMAPEQLKDSKGTDARADIYAIGAILYEALSRRPPYNAETLPELVIKVVTEPLSPLDELRPDVPQVFREVVEHALHKDREARIQTARELADRLEAIAESPDTPDVSPRISGPAASLTSTAPITPAATPASGATPFAAESVPRAGEGGGRRLPLPMKIGIPLILLGGIAATLAVVLSSGSETPTDRAPLAQPPAEALVDAGGGTAEHPPDAAGEIEAAGPGTEPIGDSLPEVEPPAPVTVRFVTRPAGARVLAGDTELCAPTPCTADLDPEEITITFERRGFRTVQRELTPPFDSEVTSPLTRAGTGSGDNDMIILSQ